MKFHCLPLALAFSLLQPASLSLAGDLFNPSPAQVESPRDGAEAVKRLTANSEGKTPVIKALDPAWIKSLADRGEPTLYTRSNSQNFSYVGMPVGGIGAGEIYLSGDGRLWDWDVFGTRCRPGFPVEQGLAYRSPHKAGDARDSSQQILEQGFVIRTRQGEKVTTRTLDRDGFANIAFSGQYPIGSVDYRDPASPVCIHLDAFSPYVPSDLEDSSYPATILSYTVENTSREKVECTVGGWMENAAGIGLRNEVPISLDNTVSRHPGYTTLNFGMKKLPSANPPPTTFDDFESGTYDQWTVEGEAFGTRPAKLGEIQHTSPIVGAQGQYLVDTYLHGDQATGKLTSTPFVIRRPYLTFLIGGGNNGQKECMNLLVGGKAVRSATGENSENLRPANWELKDLIGKTAQLQIVDQATGGWGHILVDHIAFADDSGVAVEDHPDFGNMALAVLGEGAEAAAQVTGDNPLDACLDVPASNEAERRVSGNRDKLIGALRCTRVLAPGEKMTVSFIVAWYFPNPLALGLATPMNRQYSVRFKSAQDVADHLAANFDRLAAATHAWRDTWYDSTLPYYFSRPHFPQCVHPGHQHLLLAGRRTLLRLRGALQLSRQPARTSGGTSRR